MSRNGLAFAAVALAFAFSSPASALDIEMFGGTMSYERLDGCCQSTGAQAGAGVSVTLPAGGSGLWSFSGYSDRRWSEFSVLRPFYLLGVSEENDPSNDAAVTVHRVSDWKWSLAYGGGFFTHSTRTLDFDLPAIASGFTMIVQTELIYALNDQWALAGTVRGAAGLSANDRGLLTGAFLGVVYRPK